MTPGWYQFTRRPPARRAPDLARARARFNVRARLCAIAFLAALGTWCSGLNGIDACFTAITAWFAIGSGYWLGVCDTLEDMVPR